MINTDWCSNNNARTDELWKGFAPNVGMVAIDNGVGRNMDLYSTEPFPWDSSKEVYMLEGYHSLHCLLRFVYAFLLSGPVNGPLQKMYIYRALREFDRDLPQTTPIHHHIHCLDALLQTAICSADDTLGPAGSDAGEAAAECQETAAQTVPGLGSAGEMGLAARGPVVNIIEYCPDIFNDELALGNFPTRSWTSSSLQCLYQL